MRILDQESEAILDLQSARQRAYSSVNFAMIEAYWQIGKRIVEEEQQGEARAAYGEGIIKELSKALREELGKGFSVANLENFRKFYLVFPVNQKPYALRRELTWTHYRLIMRAENEDARNYYLNESAEQNWSTRVLERNINSFYYQRILSSKNKSKAFLDSKTLEKANHNDFIKDPYVFEFLNIPEPIKAKEAQYRKHFSEALVTIIDKSGFKEVWDLKFTFPPASIYAYNIGDNTLKMKSTAYYIRVLRHRFLTFKKKQVTP